MLHTHTRTGKISGVHATGESIPGFKLRVICIRLCAMLPSAVGRPRVARSSLRSVLHCEHFPVTENCTDLLPTAADTRPPCDRAVYSLAHQHRRRGVWVAPERQALGAQGTGPSLSGRPHTGRGVGRAMPTGIVGMTTGHLRPHIRGAGWGGTRLPEPPGTSPSACRKWGRTGRVGGLGD